MLRFRTVIPAAALILSAAACASEPTAPAVRAASPRMDGNGFGLGSGNKSDSTKTQSANAGALVENGFGLGSGN